MTDFGKVKNAIDQIVEGKALLRELDVIRSERLVGEIGEWFVETLFDAPRANATSQKGWDNMIGDKKLQVKTHAKGDDNNARWTENKYSEEDFDELIIIVFTKEFKLKEFYRAPSSIVMERSTGKQRVIKWDELSDFRIKLKDLPKQELISLFI